MHTYTQKGQNSVKKKERFKKQTRRAEKRDGSSCTLRIKCVWCVLQSVCSLLKQREPGNGETTRQQRRTPVSISAAFGVGADSEMVLVWFFVLTFSGSESAKIQIISGCVLGVQICGWHPTLFFCCADKPPAC